MFLYFSHIFPYLTWISHLCVSPYFPWISHSFRIFSMDFPYFSDVSQGFSMDFLWISHGFPPSCPAPYQLSRPARKTWKNCADATSPPAGASTARRSGGALHVIIVGLWGWYPIGIAYGIAINGINGHDGLLVIECYMDIGINDSYWDYGDNDYVYHNDNGLMML